MDYWIQQSIANDNRRKRLEEARQNRMVRALREKSRSKASTGPIERSSNISSGTGQAKIRTIKLGQIPLSFVRLLRLPIALP